MAESKPKLSGPYPTRDERKPYAVTIKHGELVTTLRFREQHIAERATNRLRRHGMSLEAIAAEISRGA